MNPNYSFQEFPCTNFEFLIAFSVVCGNGLRYVLPPSINLQGRCMDILTAMTDVANDECQLNMDNLCLRTWMVSAGLSLPGSVRRNRRFHEWRQLNRANTPAATPQQYFNRTFTISFITDLLSEIEPLFRKCIKVMTWMEPMNITSDCIWITRTLSFLSNCPKCKLGIGIRVDQNCACLCVRARACMRLRKGIVLRVCLQVSCGAPPRPPALDPPLVALTSYLFFLAWPPECDYAALRCPALSKEEYGQPFSHLILIYWYQ